MTVPSTSFRLGGARRSNAGTLCSIGWLLASYAFVRFGGRYLHVSEAVSAFALLLLQVPFVILAVRWASSEVSLAPDGAVFRSAGVLSRPVRIPYEGIVHAEALSGPGFNMLDVLLRDGRTFRFGPWTPLRVARQARIVQAVAEALNERVQASGQARIGGRRPDPDQVS